MLEYMKFPERVWFPTGQLKDGTITWASRPADEDDQKRRRAMMGEVAQVKVVSAPRKPKAAAKLRNLVDQLSDEERIKVISGIVEGR